MEKGTLNYVWSKADRISEGQYGAVFKGRHRTTGQEVAIKLCDLSRCTIEDQQSYIEDVGLLLTFNSPFITKYFAKEQYGSIRPKCAVVMELADGSLGKEIKANGYGIPKEPFLVLVDNCVRALEYLDFKKLSHRDIKPDNILVFRKPRLAYKFCDFGFSRLLSNLKESMHSMVGTFAYMPAFMIKEYVSVGDVRYTKDEYDVYATACCFFEAATGQRPFQLRDDKPFEIEICEFSRMRPHNIACARFDTKKGKYLYEKELPKQHSSYKSKFRQELSKYFQLVLDKDKKFLDLQRFAGRSRELVATKDYRYSYLNTLVEESFWRYELNGPCFSLDEPAKPFFPSLIPLSSFDYPRRYHPKAPVTSEDMLASFATLDPLSGFPETEGGSTSFATVIEQRLNREADVKLPLAVPGVPGETTSEKGVELHSSPGINHKTGPGVFSLLAAVERSNCEEAKFILQGGAPPDATYENGESVLCYAASHGDLDMVELLVDNGANIAFSNDKRNSWTPFHYASEEGQLKVVECFLKHGADVNVKTENGCTPLICATDRNQHAVAVLLTNRGADVNAADHEGKTALKNAAWSGDFDLVKVLVANGADIACCRSDGLSALHCACEGGYAEIAEYLLDNGAAVDAVNAGECTPLMLAAKNGRSKVVSLLIERKANVDAADEDGETALQIALFYERPDVVRLLLEARASVNTKEDFEGFTPLHDACLQGYSQIGKRYSMMQTAAVISGSYAAYDPLLFVVSQHSVSDSITQ